MMTPQALMRTKMTTVPNLPNGVRYITVVFRVPPPDSPDYHELSRVLSHPWSRNFAAGDHLNLNLKPENDQGRRR